MRKKYFTEEERLIARRRVPETGNVHKVEKLELPTVKYNEELIQKLMLCNTINTCAIVILIISLVCIFFSMYFLFTFGILALLLFVLNSTIFKVRLNYNMSYKVEKDYYILIKSWFILNKSSSLFQALYSTEARKRTHGGAGNLISHFNINIKTTLPYYISSNIDILTFNIDNGIIFLLPDKMLVKKGGSFAFIEYNKLNIRFKNQTYICETNSTPSDTNIIGRTWKYVNNNGTPDRRFKNNYQLNECEFCILELNVDELLNVNIYFSNRELKYEIGSDCKNLIVDVISNVKYEYKDKCFYIDIK